MRRAGAPRSARRVSPSGDRARRCCGGGEVARLPLSSRRVFVCDRRSERLRGRRTGPGRARAGRTRIEDLLAEQCCEDGSSRFLRAAGRCGARPRPCCRTPTRPDQVRSRGLERVQARREPVHARSPGHRASSSSPRGPSGAPGRGPARPRSSEHARTVSTAYSGMPSARCTIAPRASAGSPGDEPVESAPSRPRRGVRGARRGPAAAAPQPRRSSASSGRASARTKIGVRRDRSSRWSTKSSRPVVGPLQVLEHQHHGVLREPLEEQAPRRRTDGSLVGRAASRRARGGASEAGHEEESSSGRRHSDRDDRSPTLSPAQPRNVVLGDAGAHPDHLGERPVRGAFAVGGQAPTVPADVSASPSTYFSNSHASRRLPTRRGRRPTTRRARRSAVAWKRSFTQRGARGRARRTAPPSPAERGPRRAGRDDAQRPPGRWGSGLALQLVVAASLVRDGRLGRPSGGLADQHRPGVAADCTREAVLTRSPATMPLALGPHGDGRLAGEDAGPGDRSEPVRRRARPPRRRGRGRPALPARRRPPGRPGSPHRHHGVADELLDGAAVPGHQAFRRLEVPRQELADLLPGRATPTGS